MGPRALLYVDGNLAGPAEYPVSALAGETAAVFATQVRFYQPQGYDATLALSSGAIMTIASWTAITVLFLVSPPFA